MNKIPGRLLLRKRWKSEGRIRQAGEVKGAKFTVTDLEFYIRKTFFPC
jgi:hypothetical protein